MPPVWAERRQKRHFCQSFRMRDPLTERLNFAILSRLEIVFRFRHPCRVGDAESVIPGDSPWVTR